MVRNTGNTEQQEHPMTTVVDAQPSEPQQAQDGFGSLSEDKGKKNIADTNAQSNVGYTSRKATAARSLDPRLPAVKSSSVFDRLYKSHTVASKTRSLHSRSKLKPSARAKLSNRKTTGLSIDVDKDLLNFNRMTISRSRKVSTPHKIRWESNRRKTSFPSFSTPQPKKPMFSDNQAPHTAPSKSSPSSIVTPRALQRVYEFSPRMKPLTKLYFISKFHPGVGLEPIEPISLGYTFFQTFCEYETGGINSEDIAKEIFITFFKKDHSQGIRHWKLHEPVVEEVNENDHSRQHGKTKTYTLTMDATYAWGNIYRVAHAKGVVRFKGTQNREIFVENFTYNLTGDP